MGPCNNILLYIQQDATLHSLFYLETALHVSGGTSTHQQERKQLYLQHLVLHLFGYILEHDPMKFPTQCEKTSDRNVETNASGFFNMI